MPRLTVAIVLGGWLTRRGGAIRCLLACCWVIAFAAGLHAQSSPAALGLRIVVVEGEDAVNIVTQRTAVAPVVEVRDRNDQPVAGAVVRFTIAKGRATFNGARTLTVTTDAAGRATAAGLTPSGAGPLQIATTASFQRETVTATIGQTNVTTVGAQAAAAGASTAAGAAVAGAAAGGAAAASGGLGAVAIGAIAAGAGGGALIAAREAGVIGGKKACDFSVSPTSFTIAGAGSRSNNGPSPSVQIGLSADNCGPTDWTATSNAPFVTFADQNSTGLSTIQGRGSGPLFFYVEANPPGSVARSGSFSVANQTVTVNQNGRCLYDVSPSSLTFPHAGGTLFVTVTVTPSVCDTDTWTASTISSFISFSPAGGKGSGVVGVTAAPNPFTGPGLTGNVTIAGVIISFFQP